MRIPVLKGTIKRRFLINYRVEPETMQRLLPAPFRPKLQQDFAIAGICLIRLEQIRPAGLPAALGLTSENAAHRVAVEWTDAAGETREGVFIPRRDTDSRLNSWAGGRIFPGEQHHARFAVVDDGERIDFAMDSGDREVSLRIAGAPDVSLPITSCFASLEEASVFFEGGCLGYSATSNGSRLDGMVLRTSEWQVGALNISRAHSSYFDDHGRFPPGTVVFDHALVMRNIRHEWHQAEDLRSADASR